jgi:hypothetical protein
MSAIKWAYARLLYGRYSYLLRPAWVWRYDDDDCTESNSILAADPGELVRIGYEPCTTDEAAYAYWQTTREALNPCWAQLQREGRKEVER